MRSGRSSAARVGDAATTPPNPSVLARPCRFEGAATNGSAGGVSSHIGTRPCRGGSDQRERSPILRPQPFGRGKTLSVRGGSDQRERWGRKPPCWNPALPGGAATNGSAPAYCAPNPSVVARPYRFEGAATNGSAGGASPQVGTRPCRVAGVAWGRLVFGRLGGIL